MRRKSGVILGVLVALLLGVGVAGQGPFPAQIQAAIRALLAGDQTVTGAWTFSTPPVGSGAPADATYLTQTANSTLSAEQALGLLATGILNVTTTTGAVTSFAPTDDNVLVGSGLVWALKAFTSCSAATSAVTYNTTTNALGCNTVVAGAAGNTTEVQFSNAGAFAGDAGLTYNSGSDALTVVGTAQAGNSQLTTGGAVRGSTTTAQTWLLQGYDNDTGPAYVTFGTVTNGNTPSLVISAPAGGATITLAPTTLTIPSGTNLTGGTVSGTSVSSGAFVGTTTSPAVANVGADSCGTSPATIAGTDNAWAFTVGATAGTACRVTFDTTAPTTWECAVGNKTTLTLNATPHQTASSATTVDISATAFVAGDVIGGVCFAR